MHVQQVAERVRAVPQLVLLPSSCDYWGVEPGVEIFVFDGIKDWMLPINS